MGKVISIKKSIYTGNPDLYWSGFCLTDNNNFCEFYLNSNRIPKLNYPFKSFKFDESDLHYVLGKSVKAKKVGESTFFDKLFVDNVFIMYFINRYGDGIKFYEVRQFLHNQVNGVVGIVKDKKLIGLLFCKGENHGTENDSKEDRGNQNECKG